MGAAATRACAAHPCLDVRATESRVADTSERFLKTFTISTLGPDMTWTQRIRHLTAVGLLGTGVIHVQQWFAGYRDVPITGTLFLLQGVAAVVLAGWLYADEDDLIAPSASALLMLGSLVALGIAFGGVFINVAERVLRPATFLSIVTELMALGGAIWLLRTRRERGTGRRTPARRTGAPSRPQRVVSER